MQVELLQKTLSVSKWSKECVYNMSRIAKDIKLSVHIKRNYVHPRLSKGHICNISEMAKGTKLKLSGRLS